MGDVFYMPSTMPEPGVFKSWVAGPERTGQRPAYFNSSLSTAAVTGGSNATLTIYLRLHLVKRNSKDAPAPKTRDGRDIELVDWDDTTDQFGAFKRGAKTAAEAFWNNAKFCLVPPADYRGLDWPPSNPTVRPNIDCHFEIVWAGGPLDAHAVIECFRPKIAGSFRSNAGGSYDGAGQGQWSSFDLEAKTSDARIPMAATCEQDVGDPLARGGQVHQSYRCDKWPAQEAVCHEVGHLLGLDHVGQFFKMPGCMNAIQADPANGSGSMSCYEGPTGDDTENIMGAGLKVALWNILPWATRVTSHTGISLTGWRGSLKSVRPRRL
jgi:hypothetical protein